MFVRNMVHAPGPADGRAAASGQQSAIPAPRQMTRSAGDPSDLHGMRRGIDVAWPTVRDTGTTTRRPVPAVRDYAP